MYIEMQYGFIIDYNLINRPVLIYCCSDRLVGLLDDLTLKDVETRVLNWLVNRSPPTGSAEVKLGSTKRVLAAELATSGETLSRTFARLRDAGLIAVVRVSDAAALRTRFRRLLGED